MNTPLVNLQILGVQKAGTSALAHFLAQHPHICVVDGKEAHVFDQPDFHQQTDKFTYAQKRYNKKLPHYKGEALICDATPITLFNPTYLKACIDYNPNAYFIVILRDPVERAISHFSMSRSKGREKHNMLISFLIEPWRLRKEQQWSSWSGDSAWRNHSYLARGEYKRQLTELENLISPDQLLVLSQNDLLQKHDASLRKIFKFLNVEQVSIPQETIFPSPTTSMNLMDRLAKLYAKAYFLLKRQ